MRVSARVADVAVSLTLLEALHARWVLAMRVLPAEAYTRTLRRPDLGVMTVDRLVALCARHGRHHVAHVTALRVRMGAGRNRAQSIRRRHAPVLAMKLPRSRAGIAPITPA